MTSPKSTRVLTRRHQTPRGGRVFAQQIRQGRELSLRAARCKCPQDICQDAHDPARAGIKAVSTCLCAMAPSHEHQSGVLGHMAPRSDTTLSLSQGMARAIKLLHPLAEALSLPLLLLSPLPLLSPLSYIQMREPVPTLRCSK